VAWDTHGFYRAGNPDRLTVPAGMGGKYLCHGAVVWFPNATGSRALMFKKNGAVYSAVEGYGANAGGNPTWQNITAVLDLAAGDYVILACLQTSGGALTIDWNASYAPMLTITYLGV
jgi:hypothetical protein